MRSIRCAVLAVALSALAARADEPSETNKAAVELTRTTLPPERWADVMKAMKKGMTAMMAGKHRDDFDAYFEKSMPAYQEMVDLTAGLYVKYYTADEIAELAKFYRSPIGQKSLKIAPQLMGDVMGWAQHRAVQVMEELKKKPPQ